MKFEQRDLDDLADALAKVGLLGDMVAALSKRKHNPLPVSKIPGKRGLHIDLERLTTWALAELGIDWAMRMSDAEFATGYKPLSDIELAEQDDLPGHKG